MKIYTSHSIQGKYGKNATHVQMQTNCDAIIKLVKQLRVTFPTVEFYIPAESEPFVIRAIRKNYLTVKQVLEIDCMIIDDCDAVIVYVPEGDELQGGRKIEYDHAVKNNIPVCIFELPSNVVSWITRQIIRN